MSCFGSSKQAEEPEKKSFFGKAASKISCFGGSSSQVSEEDNTEFESARVPKSTSVVKSASAPGSKKAPKPKKADVERAEFGLKTLYDSGDDAEVDIVAVHGLNGHRERTFTADNEVCWLNSLLPVVIPKIRVLSYGYDARTHGSSPLSSEHLLGHAEDLLETLTMRRDLTESTRRPIIFVAHSLGGIVVKSALNLSAGRNINHRESQRAIKLSTYGILFMGTPHRGSEGASWASLALNIVSVAQYTNPEILAHLKQNSEWLENQQTMFLPISSHFHTTYFYERYPTMIAGRPVLVVPKYSAYLGLSDAGVMAINAGHRDMVRYRNAEDEGFERVSGTLRIMLKKAPEKVNENWQMEEAVKAIGKAQKISYLIPMKLPFSRNHNFTGRHKELSKMHEVLKGDSDASHPRIAILYGLGGMGKTQLANQYAYLHEEDYTSTWWVNAKTTETFSQGFFDIAQELIAHHARIRVHTGQKPDFPWIATALGLPVDTVNEQGQLLVSQDLAQIQVIIDAVKAWLAAEENHQWLLIIDNYDDLESVDIRGFLPTNSPGSAIITTRSPDTRRLGRGIEIARVEQEDALEILRKSANTDIDEFHKERDDAIAIIEKLDGLPLALDQAGAFISAMQISYSQYLPQFDTKFAEIAAKKPPTSVWQYREDTVFTTWEISFNALGHAAQELLILCGFLDNEDVWEGLFPMRTIREKFGIESLGYAIREIFALSLAKRKNLGDSFWIHPMVHRWSHERLDINEKEIRALSAISLTSATLSGSSDGDRQNPARLALERKLMPHILVCYDHICRDEYVGPFSVDLDHLEEVKVLRTVLSHHWKLVEAEGLTQWVLAGFEKALGSGHTKTSGMANSMGFVLANQGRYDDALELYKRAFTGFENVLGSDNANTLTTVHNMASVFHAQGKYDEALEWYGRALAEKEKVLGKDHPSTLITVQSMAAVFVKQGKFDDALQWFQRALSGEEALGKDHPSNLTTINNMALVFYMQGNYDEALKLYKQALAGRERALGEDHPSTLGTVNNMASVFDKQGKYDEALELYRRALAGFENPLGKDHPKTLGIISNMALVFDEQGKYDDALEWLGRALAGREKTLGKDHLDTLTTANHMASVLDKQGKHEDALELYKRALVGREKDLGVDHPSTLITVHNMATSFLYQGKYDDAVEWFKRALAGEEKNLGKEHPSTLTTMHNMASVFFKQGRYDEALELFGRVLHGREKVLGKRHPDTLVTINNMASVLDTQGRYVGALVWYKRALAEKLKTLGKDHPSTLGTINNMASVFSAQGKYDNALEWFGRALAGLERTLGKDNRKTLSTVNNIAMVFDKQGKYDDALEWYGRALAGDEKNLGKDHPDTMITVNNMASVFENQGKYDDALEWYGRALAGLEKALGKDHPSTLTTVNNMASVFNKQERYNDALEWFELALAGREKALGSDHPNTIATRNSLLALKQRLLELEALG